MPRLQAGERGLGSGEGQGHVQGGGHGEGGAPHQPAPHLLPPLRPEAAGGGGHPEEAPQGPAGQGHGRQRVPARAAPRHLHQDQEHPGPGVQGAGAQGPAEGPQGPSSRLLQVRQADQLRPMPAQQEHHLLHLPCHRRHGHHQPAHHLPVGGRVPAVLPQGHGVCTQLAPTYVGICGEGEHSTFTSRLGQHLGSATQACQVDTGKPVGRHFRLPGHQAPSDIVMLPIEVVSSKDPFLLRARETFHIVKFKTKKRLGVTELEHGLNLEKSQSLKLTSIRGKTALPAVMSSCTVFSSVTMSFCPKNVLKLGLLTSVLLQTEDKL